MATADDATVTFDEPDGRADAMRRTITNWIADLQAGIADAQASAQFQAWLDVQRRFHDYSARNTLLIRKQYPDATHVAGYQTWQEEFDRYVTEGAQAIWIWAPIIANQCPACGHAPSYHADTDCEYDDTTPDSWSRGPVGFKPVPVFDVSQTEGEPLPELDTAATGEVDDLVDRLIDAASTVGVTVRIVPETDWAHGAAAGVCDTISLADAQPVVEVRDRQDDAAVAATLVHEYAHALLHGTVEDETAEATREVEAEAVAYIVGRHCGLDMRGSAFYLAAWAGDDTDVIHDRLDRISRTAEEIIAGLDG